MTVTVRGAFTAEQINNFDRSVPGIHYHFAASIAHAAATATEKIASWVAPHDCHLKSIYFVPLTAVSGANTNTTHLNVINVGVSAGTTEIANLDLTSGNNLTANAKNVVTEALSTDLTAGDVVAIEAEKIGTGLDVPAGYFVFAYTGS